MLEEEDGIGTGYGQSNKKKARKQYFYTVFTLQPEIRLSGIMGNIHIIYSNYR